MQIEDKIFELFLTAKVIQDRIQLLAQDLTKRFNGQQIVAVTVLNGALFFASDVLRAANLNAELCCVRVSSYEGTKQTGSVTETLGLTTDLSNKHVLLIEDIVDSGLSLDYLIEAIQTTGPASITTAALLYKPSAHKGKNRPDFVGFHIPNKFVVGYGMDYNGFGRTYSHIYQLKD